MTNTWIVVAHRGGARIFARPAPPGRDLTLQEDIAYPQGKLQSKDLGSDRPGHIADSHGTRHAFVQEQEPAAHVTERFANQLAALLDDGRRHRRYDRLVLVAEPHFLGILQAALSSQTAELVTATVIKDLGHVHAHELPGHLGDLER